jgi:CBS domain-containing protein
MRRGAITCNEETSIRDIAQIMVVNQVRYCVVISKDHEVTGIVSADSLICTFGLDLDETRARDIIVKDKKRVFTTTGKTLLTEAIDIMKRQKIGHLVVLADHPASRAVLGVLLSSDIVAEMARRQEEGAL